MTVSARFWNFADTSRTTAVRHLLAHAEGCPRTKVVHHFIQYPATNAIDLFRSLARQLVQVYIESNKVCPSDLANDLDLHFGACNRSPDLDEVVEEILLPLANAFDTLIICVDGIDVIDRHEQELVWSGLQKVSQKRAELKKSTRTLITSENESRLATLLPANSLRIRVDRDFISDDIAMYIDRRLQERAHPRQLFHDAELRARVKSTLLDRAENM